MLRYNQTDASSTKFIYYSNDHEFSCLSSDFCEGKCSNNNTQSGVFYKINDNTSCIVNDVEEEYVDFVFCQIPVLSNAITIRNSSLLTIIIAVLTYLIV